MVLTTKVIQTFFALMLVLGVALLMFALFRPPAQTDPVVTADKTADLSGKSLGSSGGSSVQSPGGAETSESTVDPPSANMPSANATPANPPSARAPQDKTLRLTVPKMERVSDAVVPTTAGDDEEALKTNAGIHLDGTGYPWEKEANVYIAGHREGFPGTPSHLAFHDLDVLEPDDPVILTDGDGNTYAYRVSEKRVVAADDLSVLRATSNENVLTLQSCTLPDYTDRLVVRAERS